MLCVLLVFAPASDVAVKLLQVLVLDDAPRPFVGLTRVLYHVETALVMAWPVGICAAAWVVFGAVREPSVSYPSSARRFPLTVLSRTGGAWALAVGAFIAAHPLPRGWTAPLLRGWTLACVVAGVVAVVRAWRSLASWGRSATRHALLLLLGFEAAVAIVGPYVGNPFADWAAGQLLYLVGISAVAVVLARSRGRAGSSAL